MRGLIFILILSVLSVNAFAADPGNGKNKNRGKHYNNHSNGNGNYDYYNNSYSYGSPNNDDFICDSSLKLKLPNEGVFQVKIDGNRYRDLHRGQRIDGIPSGRRFVKVWQMRRHPHGGPVQKKVWFKGFMVFNDCQVVVAKINRNRHFIIKDIRNKEIPASYYEFPTVVIPETTPQFPYCEGCSGYHDGACSAAAPPPQPPHCNGCSGYHEGTCSAGGYHDGHNHPPHGNGYHGPEPMHPDSFQSFLSAVADRSFDSSKLEVVKMGAESNFFTSAQVYEIVRQFSFDSNKLKVAKICYGRTVDQQNYTMLFDQFSFDSSVTNLSQFMRNNG